MGTDIHCFPEYMPEGNEVWRSLCGEFHVARDYDIFGKMAGVRGGTPLFPARGIPRDISSDGVDAGFIFVDDFRAAPEFRTSFALANQFVSEGRSFWLNEHRAAYADLDFYSHSWLLRHEYRAVLDAERAPGLQPIDASYWALLAALDEIEQRSKSRTRLVFWFDN